MPLPPRAAAPAGPARPGGALAAPRPQPAPDGGTAC